MSFTSGANLKMSLRQRPASSRRNALMTRPITGRKLQITELESRITPDVTNATQGTLFTWADHGTNALIQAVAAANNGDLITLNTVGGSDYLSPGQIPVSLTLQGPNVGINPNTGTRAPEVNINTTIQPLSIASGKSLTVDGLAFTTPGGRGALTVFATNYSVVFQNNLIEDQAPTYRSVYVSTSDINVVGYTSALITANRILDNAPDIAAIRLSTGDNGVVSDNVIIGAYAGVQINSSAGYGANNSVVTNNYIANTSQEGIAIANNAFNSTVTYNTIVNANTSQLDRRGAIRIYSFSNVPSPGPSGNLVVTNNLITNSHDGILFSGGTYPPGLTSLLINTNSVGVNAGRFPFGSGNVNDATVNFSGNYSGTTDPTIIEASLDGVRNSVVQSFLTSGANLRTGALSDTSGQWGFDPDLAIVQMNVPETAATSGLTKVDGVIQTGIDLALTGMVVNVAEDTFPQSPNLDEDVILRPAGSDTGTVSITGGTFSKGTVEFDLNGTAPGTGYDVIATSGTLNLTGSALGVTVGYDAQFADYYDIVTGPTTGTFVGQPNGSKISTTFNSKTYDFLVAYNPNPNIIRLINVGPGQPNEVVVNEDWAGLNFGQIGFSAQFPGRIFGVTAFADIASALTYIADGGTIIVAASGPNGPFSNDYAGFTLSTPVSFVFVADTDYGEDTVTLGGPILLDGEPLSITLDQTSFGPVNIASSATGTIEALGGAPAVTITTDTVGQGTANLLGEIGANAAPVDSLTIGTLATVSVTMANTNGTGTAISIVATGDVNVGALNAGTADVELESTTGAIIDINGAATNVTGGLLTVNAATTIDLDTDLTNLNLTSVGNSTIRDVGGFNVDTATVGTSTLSLTAAGSITQTDEITAGSLLLITTGGGNVTLTNADNAIDLLAGDISGDLSLVNSTNVLTIGTVGTTTGLSVDGNLSVSTAKDLLVSEAVLGDSSAALLFGQITSGTADINAGITSSGAITITGGTGNDVVNVNAAINGATALVNGAGGTNVLTILGTSGDDVIDVNKSVAKSFVARGGQAEYANFGTLNLTGLAGEDTFLLGFGEFAGAGGFLPAIVNIDAGADSDTATIWMPAGNNNTPTTEVKVNWGNSSAAIRGGETVNYDSGLELLTIQGNTGQDWFYVRPDADTELVLNGAAPFSPPGDRLELDVLGLTTGINTTNATIPDGYLTGTQFAKVSWTSIESLPVPLGLGGSFDFGSITSPIQETGIGTNADPLPIPNNTAVTWIRVPGATTFAGNSNLYGWDQTVSDYVRFTGGPNELPAEPNRDLLQDGAFWSSGPANKRSFQVAVEAGGTYQVTVFSGDNAPLNGSKGQIWIEGVQLDSYDVPAGKFYTNRFTVTDSDNDGILNISFFNPSLDGWSLANGVDVRPINWIAPVDLVRDDGVAAPVAADGVTIDQYNFTGGQPNQVFTVTTTFGTLVNADNSPMSDADISLNGLQFQADASGNATIFLRRPTGTTTAEIDIFSAYGDAKLDGGPFEQDYFVPSSPPPLSPPATDRKFDFNGITSPAPTETGFTPVQFNQAYVPSSANGSGVGWLGGNTNVFDRKTASAGFVSTNDLNRDGQSATVSRTFVSELAASTTFAVTVWMGDPAALRTGMTVAVNPAYGSMIGGTPTILPGSSPATFTNDPPLPFTPTAGSGTYYLPATQTYVVSPTSLGTIAFTFLATSSAAGELGITFGNVGISPNTWSVQGITFVPTSPLLPQESFVASSLTSSAPKLSEAELQPIVNEAISRWAGAGLSAEQLTQLSQVQFNILDLSGGQLGLHVPGTIYLDDDGAGRGWFIDATPNLDEEFADGQGLGAAGEGYDLLTVVMHEMGHQLGLPDLTGGTPSLMSSTLPLGTRRVATWQDLQTTEEIVPLTVPTYSVPTTPVVGFDPWGPAPSTSFASSSSNLWTVSSNDSSDDELFLHGIAVS